MSQPLYDSEQLRRALYPHADRHGPAAPPPSLQPAQAPYRAPIPAGVGNGAPSGGTGRGQPRNTDFRPAPVLVDRQTVSPGPAVDRTSGNLTMPHSGADGQLVRGSGFAQPGRMPPTFSQARMRDHADGHEPPAFNPTGFFERPPSRFSFVKGAVLDWTVPPDGYTYTLLNVGFSVWQSHIGAIDSWYRDRATSSLEAAATDNGAKILGYLLWEDRSGILSREYVLQLALVSLPVMAQARMANPGIVAGIVAIAILLAAVGFIIWRMEPYFFGKVTRIWKLGQTGAPAPVGAIGPDGKPLTPGTPMPAGSIYPVDEKTGGLFDLVDNLGPLLLLVVGAIALSGRK